MSKFIISVGHTASGNIGSGACDLLDESNCTREVAPLVVNKLKSLGHEAVLLRVDKSNSYNCEDCYVRANQANNTGGDLFVEIHFNSGINRQGDGSEVCIVSNNSKAKPYAERISSELANALGITNRGVKVMSLIVLNKTSMPSCLVECQFVDGKNANNTYNADKIANAIVKGLTGQTVTSTKEGWNENNKGWWYCTDISNGYYYKDEWFKVGQDWYYADEQGYSYQNRWLKHKNNWYYFKDNCKMTKNETLTYKFNSNGEWING
ncbi:N-acetylmuramoyl-L-alanine amidase [Clostridium botulinum]|nr:N-acetylmuramoyl-L-alanine amidase [Clostridium botulinum]NFP00030.1 N-acetylmuramoyl-L-alanine amidase [Clostridium botulinum]